MSTRKLCTELLPYISGMSQMRLVSPNERNMLVRLMKEEKIDEVYSEIYKLHQTSVNPFTKIMLDKILEERRNTYAD